MKRTSLFTAFAMMGALAGCGGDGGGGASDVTMASTGAQAKYVANTLLVPQQRSDYAMDLNGDGKTDNQLGNIIGALTAQNLNTQQGVDDALTMGNVILLIDEQAADLTNNEAAGATVSVGVKANTPPKYDGTDTFSIDSSITGGQFFGKITNGTFSSNAPSTTTHPTTVTVQLPLVSGSTPVKLVINGAHIQFTKAGDNAMKGQINGAIKNKDVQESIIPSVAMLLNSKVQDNSGQASTNAQILSIFDTGGGDADASCNGACKGIDGVCGVAGNKMIEVCEVATNSIIKNVLAPDVQMFDDAGNYKPNKDNTKKDSLSLGLSFTAVKASF